MGLVRAIGFCPICGEYAVFVRFVCPLWIHVVLTVATAGIWLIAAPLAHLHRTPWRCTRCGGRAETAADHRAPENAPSLGGPDPLHSQGGLNTLLVGHHLVYYLPTNASFRNDRAA